MTPTTELMRTLAWSLLHFLWQGAAIAAVAAAFMFVFRKPATRYLVGIAALALMLVSFGITFTLISGSSGAAAEVSAAGAPAAASLSSLGAHASPDFHLGEQAAVSSEGGFLWIARTWLAGVFVFALRIAFGLLVIEHLRRRNLIALPDALVDRFRALQRRLGIRRNVRYAECHSLSVPAVIGFFRPIVLLPMRALTGLTPEQLEAVIAHELGHIKRFDVAVNFFQVIAESLFFFHPAVWWLNKRIRADREDCCDDVAIATCGGTVGYARALATMESWRDVPSFAMAATGSPVTARVARLLGVSTNKGGGRTAGMVTASLVLATALIAGAVSLGVAHPAMAQNTVSLEQLVVQAEVAVTPAPKVSAQPAASPEPVPAAEPAPRPASPPAPAVAPKPPREPKPARPANPAAPPAPPAAPSAVSYIAEMKSSGFDNLDVDNLIAMKVHGITPEYIREIRSIGFEPDAEGLIALKVQGVTPEYVRDMRALGFNPGVDDIVAMKVQNVTPEYVKEMRAKGLNAGVDDLIAMKVHDVTPEYRQALERAGFKLDTSELIEAKVMDITPEFVKQAQAHGFKNLSIDQLIQLKHADVL
ncbi:MAG TPA: M56 family metallopeptidase [Steroidobacteraceae bacterium]|nr:M56 family metallopeptidase [Steroidobacteraceae bacterium]